MCEFLSLFLAKIIIEVRELELWTQGQGAEALNKLAEIFFNKNTSMSNHLNYAVKQLR